MRRSILIALSILGALVVILLVAVASVGSDLDEVRIERDDFEIEVEDLQRQVDSLTEERDRLQRDVEERSKTIEQWKAELERARSGPAAQPAPSGVEEPVPAESPAP